jgi:alpha-glucosidase (family GH31 glycosyl hydrolase)
MSSTDIRKQTVVAVMFFAILFIGLANTAFAYTMMGDIQSKDQDGYNITFTCEEGKVRLSFLTDDLVRVHMAPKGKEFPKDTLHEGENGPYAVVTYTWPGAKFEVSEAFDYDLEGDVYKIKTGKIVVKARKTPFKLAFYDLRGKLLVKEKDGIIDAGLGFEGSKVYETMELPEDEHFIGFGAHHHPLDMRGEKMICTAKELQSKRRSGGFPVPFFMSSRGYGIFFNNLDDDVTFNMGTEDEEYSFEATSGEMEGWDMDYYVIYGPKLERVMKRYTSIVGKPILPEKWFFGHIQHHCCTWTGKDVIEVARKYREGGWPCDVLIMDHQAMAKDYAWEDTYQNYHEMYEFIDARGFKTGFSSALFDKELYKWEGFDPTIEDNCKKHWSMLEPRMIDGLDFWRQDNSERSVNYTGLKKFANGYESHELFGSLWAKCVIEGQEKMGLYGRPVISRAGPIGGHRYILPWPGDLGFGLEFMEMDLNFVRNGGLAGYAAIAVDLGGFTNRGNQDPLGEQNIIRRTINMVPIIPVSKFQGDGDAGAKIPWLYTPKQQDMFRYYLKLRYRMNPYIYSSAIEANRIGRPILAPIAFDYQNDEKTYDKDFHFMFGRQILAAPVMKETEQWEVYLPAGKWVHYWSGKKFDGGKTITIDAPLYGRDGLPLFVKAGSIIPMMPEMNYIYEKKPDPITLDVYPDASAPSSYVRFDQEKPKVSPITQTVFSCSQDDGKIEISVSQSDVAYELWVHCDKAPESVTVDSEQSPNLKDKAAYNSAAKGWYFGSGSFFGSDTMNTLNIKVPKSSKAHLITIKK